MKKNIQTVLLAERNIHSNVFCSFFSRNTGLEVIHVACDNDWLRFFERGEKPEVDEELLFVIDLSNQPYISYDKMFNDADMKFCYWGCLLVNVPKNIINKELVLNWPNCRGIFNVNVSRIELSAGVDKILEGEFWLPRKIMTEIIDYYRNDGEKRKEKQKVNPPSFTNREEDILKLLATGISNAEMAETLFVSENTIKSHLYNMFKKIHVKNRSQARSWVKENYL